MQSLGKRFHSPGQMSRELRVNRTVCHRLMSGLEAGKDDLGMLTAFPGVQGLRQCVRAMERHGADRSRAASAEAAVEQYAQVVSDLAGSHARLTARIGLSAGGAGGATASSAPRAGRKRLMREQMFEAASGLMGRRIEARCGISMLRPSPTNPSELEYVHVRYYAGHEASADATPLVVAASIVSVVEGSESTTSGYCTLDRVPVDARAQNAIITPFTSDPLPLVTARDLSGRLTHVIDPKPEASRRPLDIAVGYMVPSLCAIPSSQDIPILLEAMHMREPAAAMVFDVFLHSSLAAGCRPSIDVYVGRNSGLCDVIDRWYDHVEGAPILKLLGPGLANTGSPLVPRLQELVEHVFTRLGWDASEFLGYRCEEQYPMWACDYVMAFDYRREAGPAGRGEMVQ